MRGTSTRSTASPRFRSRPVSVPAVRTPKTPVTSQTKRTTGVRSGNPPSAVDSSSAAASARENDCLRSIEKKIDNLVENENEQQKAKLERVEHRWRSTKEELQATQAELDEARGLLESSQRDHQLALKRIKELESLNESQARELDEIRKFSLNDRQLESRSPLASRENSIIVIEDDEDEHRKTRLAQVLLRQTEERLTALQEEKKEWEREREENRVLLRDMQTVVRAAQTLKEEAQAETAMWQSVSRDQDSTDFRDWAELRRVWDCRSKRNALLAWTNHRLSDHSNLHVSNFSSDWADGKVFCSLAQTCCAEMMRSGDVPEDPVERACWLADRLSLTGVSRALFSLSVDWRQVMAVVFQLYKIITTKT